MTVLISPTGTEPFSSTFRHTPQLRDVHRLLVPKSCEWDRIGCCLGVDFNFRKGLLRAGVQKTDDNKLEDVLNNWIETHCSEVSWDNLIQVLTELEFFDMVQEVRSFHQQNQISKLYMPPPHISIVSNCVKLIVNFFLESMMRNRLLVCINLSQSILLSNILI